MKKSKKIRISQSLIKEFEKKDHCPLKIKGMYIDKSFEFPASKAMHLGNYFEYLAIGESLSGEIEPVLTKAGKKTTDTLRLEEQAEVAKQMLDKTSDKFMGLTIKSVQKRIDVDLNDKYYLSGVIDIEATDEMADIVLVDLKSTGDAMSTFGDYQWGDVSRIDPIQMGMYTYLYKLKYNKDVGSRYWVFDYTPSVNIKEISVKVTDKGLSELQRRIDGTINAIDHYDVTEWKTAPCFAQCNTCGMDCPFKINKGDVIKESINY